MPSRIKAGKSPMAAGIAAMIATLLALEGGYVNHPSDPGGATNHGITEAVARANGYSGRMQDLTREQAAEIYYEQYIVKPGFLPIFDEIPAVLEEVKDTGANAGPARASRWLQESLNHFNRNGRDYPDIAEDGVVGPATVGMIARLKRVRGDRNACILLLKALDAKQANHYMRLSAARPAQFENFTVGWFGRIENVDRARC